MSVLTLKGLSYVISTAIMVIGWFAYSPGLLVHPLVLYALPIVCSIDRLLGCLSSLNNLEITHVAAGILKVNMT